MVGTTTKMSPEESVKEDVARRLGPEGVKAYHAADDAHRSKGVTKLKGALKPNRLVRFIQSDWFKMGAPAIVAFGLGGGFSGDGQEQTPEQEPPEQVQVVTETIAEFHGGVYAMLRESSRTGHQIFTSPLEYFHGEDSDDIAELFERMSAAADVLPIDGAYPTAFAADNDWRLPEEARYPGATVLVDVEDPALQSAEARDILARGIRTTFEDIEGFEGVRLTYRFSVVQDGDDTTPDRIIAVRDIGSDNQDTFDAMRIDGRVVEGADMEQVFSAEIPEP